MPDEKPKQNNLDETEARRLRDIVLSWVSKSKNIDKSIENLKPRKKSEPSVEFKNPISQIQAFRPIPHAPITATAKESEIQKIPSKKIPTVSQNMSLSQTRPTATSGTSISKEAQPSKIKLSSKTKVIHKKSHQNKKIVKMILGVVVGLLILISVILLIGIYLLGWRNGIIAAITKVVPLPVAIVNTQTINLRSWQNQVDSLNTFYANQLSKTPDIESPSYNQTQKHVLERMIDQAILEQAAEKYNIDIQQNEIDTYVQALSDEIGNFKALEVQISTLYDWTIEDFKAQIVKPIILRARLAQAVILDDRINQGARLTAEKVLTEIKAGVIPFENLALKYSEDITAVQGGDLGYFSRGQLEPAFEEAAFSLKPGETSEIVQTKFGFHIIKVEEALLDENDVVKQIRAKHILIRGKDLEAFLAELRSQSRIWRLVKIK